jgi:hypothetical protein
MSFLVHPAYYNMKRSFSNETNLPPIAGEFLHSLVNFICILGFRADCLRAGLAVRHVSYGRSNSFV